ncbi:reticulocalbin-2 isoform X2 [Lycorma delicatula]|uniref:reticulocalbin-2 isoform X2 n=1 Tax=Lycorma delicatula TaxID=130591 RepID=UPI003F5114E3
MKGLIVIAFICHLAFEVTPASPAHIHKHHINKEREEDGSYSPRDHNHITDGEHNKEFDHEAILGSMKEAEEFDHLPPEEAKKRLKILLLKMDLNKDNQIDRNELHAWILRSFSMLSEEESNERFEDADENEDGRVTWEEYKTDSFGDDFNEMNIEDSEEETLVKQDKVLFNAADRNGDGILNKKEFVLFTHPEEHPEMLPHILKNTLDDKDTDKNGVIDFQEYLGDRAKSHDKEWLVTEKEKFDEEFDKDGDGVLNAAEILSWVVPSNERRRSSGSVYLHAEER